MQVVAGQSVDQLGRENLLAVDGKYLGIIAQNLLKVLVYAQWETAPANELLGLLVFGAKGIMKVGVSVMYRTGSELAQHLQVVGEDQ